MAEKSAAEKTEPPTAERMRKAKQEGKVPQSQELPQALTIGALLLVLGMSGPQLWQWFTLQVQQGFIIGGPARRLDIETFSGLLTTKGIEALTIIAPFMVAVGMASVFSGVLMGGWVFSPKALRLRPEAINPITGFKNLVSLRSLMRLLASFAKLAVMVTIIVTYLWDKIDACLALSWATPLAALGAIMELIFGVVVRFAVAMVAIALLDILYQRWQYQRDLRMTKQEIKEERRQHEVAPEVRGRLRSMQIEIIRKRMLHEVPRADVVVTNPTHVAVALKYDARTMGAPQVTAKGADYLCERIKEIARAHQVPIIQRPELARAIYQSVDVGQVIPEPLYVAVAEVLAMVYRLRKQRQPA